MATIRRADGYWLWEGGPVPKGASAITLGPLIIMRPGAVGRADLLRHELVHVRQWRELGVVRFLVRYLGSYLLWRLRRKGHRGAYLRIPLEIEAEWQARRAEAQTAEPEPAVHAAAS